MAIDPNLLVLKSVSELETVNNPTTGSLLYYNEGDELKKTNVADFYNAMQSAYLGIATTTTTPPATGAVWYRVDTAGTYTSFLSGGSPIVVSTGDLNDKEVFLEVKDNVATKRVREIPKPLLWEKKTLFSFSKLKSADVSAVNCTISDEPEGLNVQLNDAGAPFSTQLVANNYYTPNDTENGFFSGLSERSYQKITFKQKSLLNSGSYPDMGLGLSFLSTNSFGYKWGVISYLCTNPNNSLFGKIAIQATKGINDYNSFYSESALPDYTLGDIIEFKFERELHDYIVTAKNLSKGNQISLRVTPKDNFTAYIPYNNSNQCVHVSSGNFLVYNWEYGSTLDRQADLYIAGDSITLGQGAVVEPLRWAANIGVKENNIISGGGADYLMSLKLRLQEIYVLNPKRVLICIGGNDLLLGTPTQEWKDAFDWIAYHLNAKGIPMVLAYPSARTGATELINHMNTSVFLKDLPKIDFNTPTAEGGNPEVLKTEYDSGDALHPNNAGHAKMAEVANAWLNANPL